MDRRGAILVISLWILAILSVLAAGLSHRAAVELKRARLQVQRLAAEFQCRSLITTAVASIRQEQAGQAQAGLEIEDMGGKINLRVDDNLDKALFEELFSGSGVSDQESEELAAMVIDWTDADDVVGESEVKEPPFFKNGPFRDPRELLAAMEYYYESRRETDPAGRAGKVYDAISGSISVYPEEGVNINTASAGVLGTLCRAALKRAGKPELIASVPGLVDRILLSRKTEAFKSAKMIDIISALSKEGLTEEETMILDELDNRFETSSDYYRITANQRVGGCLKSITAVYGCHGDSIAGWHEN